MRLRSNRPRLRVLWTDFGDGLRKVAPFLHCFQVW
jgi:hypothetical protein